MKIKITTIILACCGLFGNKLFAQNFTSIELGKAAAVFHQFKDGSNLIDRTYSLTNSAGESIKLHANDHFLEEGKLSMTGIGEENKNIAFIFKGEENDLYGWVANHQSKKAYEYTTNNQGILTVSEVDIAKIFPDQYTVEMVNPNQDNGPRSTKALTYSPMAQGQLPHVGPYDKQDVKNVLNLESKKGAKKVFFLDYSRIMNGEEPKYLSKEEMYITWQCFADQVSMYNINVTTNKSVYDAAGVTNSGVVRFWDEDGRSNAQLNSFGTTSYSNLYKYKTGSEYGRTTAHEGFHQLGLQHDGGEPGGEYYEGIPEFQWVPIMGNFWFGNNWDEALYQYSKGEYKNASQKQDDLTTVKRYLPFNEDDIPTSKAIKLNGTKIEPKENWGMIEQNTDSDEFTFEIIGDGKNVAHLKLKLDPIEFISMLDIDATIKDAAGKEIANSNLKVNRSAEFDLDLEPGKYTLIIKGGAEGTPQWGFSNYSSLGMYAMEGEITGGINTGISNTFLENSIKVYPLPANSFVNLEIPSSAKIDEISLFSIDGKLAFKSNANLRRINLEKLAKGSYTLKIAAENEIITRKVIKN